MTLTSAYVIYDIMTTIQETLCNVIVLTLSLSSLKELKDRKDSLAWHSSDVDYSQNDR